MNTPIIRRINLTSDFQPLATERTAGTFTIRNPSAANVILLCDDGVTELPLDRGQQFTLTGVDLADIQAKGDGFFLMVIGATRTL